MSQHPDRLRQRVVALYRMDRSIEAISRMPGMPSRKTVAAWVHAAAKAGDLELRPNGPKHPRKEILDLLEQKVPRAEICKKYGCSERWLSELATGKLEARRIRADLSPGALEFLRKASSGPVVVDGHAGECVDLRVAGLVTLRGRGQRQTAVATELGRAVAALEEGSSV